MKETPRVTPPRRYDRSVPLSVTDTQRQLIEADADDYSARGIPTSVSAAVRRIIDEHYDLVDGEFKPDDPRAVPAPAAKKGRKK